LMVSGSGSIKIQVLELLSNSRLENEMR